jgi:phosphoglycolate phosphatase-like HAD superfamily hydrolase
MSRPVRPVALDLDGVLGDTRALWSAWLEASGDLLGVRARELSDDRGKATAELDERGAGNWRDLLQRFAEERAAVYLRREEATGDALRTLASRGVAIGVFTDAPEPLARVALTQLGADRRISVLETGSDALDRVLARLGPETHVVRTRDELRAAISTL